MVDHHSKLETSKMQADLDAAQHTLAYPIRERIGYTPDIKLYQGRVKASSKRIQGLGKITSIPDKYPKELQGPMVWSGAYLVSREYIYTLSSTDITEIHYLNLDLSQVNKKRFPLPQLGIRLEELAVIIHSGLGFFMLRGLVPEEFTKEDNIIIYLGVSSYIGEQRGRQNHEGGLITHITDTTLSATPSSDRPSLYTNVAQPYHNDITPDILALYCLNSAVSGGKSGLASFWTIYNELVATRPDIIHTLSKPDWHTSGGYTFLINHALLHCEDGKPILNFARRTLTSNDKFPRTQRSENPPPLTEAQAEAIDAVHFTATKHSLEINLLQGDMLFVNNLSVLHGRNSFEDSEKSRRYFLRLWLRNPQKSWTIPQGLRRVHDLVFTPQPGIDDHYDVDPYSVPGFNLASTNCG